MTQDVQLRRLFRVVSGGTPTADPANWDGRIVWITPSDLGRNAGMYIDASARTLTSHGEESSTVIPAGSLLVSSRAPIGHVAIAGVPVAFNQGCKGLVPRVEVDERFFYYQLIARRTELQARGQGSTFLEVSTDNLSELRLDAPPLREQRRVADSLDAQTGRIDELIRLNRALLSKLPLRMRAVMHDALAGLPRNARLAFSVKWLSGGTPPRDDAASWSGDMPWASSKDLGVDRLQDTIEHITAEAARTSSNIVPSGSVLVATRGMSLAKRLPLALVEERPIAFNQDLKGLVPIAPLDGEYLRIVLRAFEGEILSSVVEAAHGTRRLETKDLKALRFPRLSTADQRRKIEEVWEVEKANDALRKRIIRHIDLLNERRQALIHTTVTRVLDSSSYLEKALSG